ncbi:alpha/beta fold hydrolase [Kribbella sp. NPDC020789]
MPEVVLSRGDVQLRGTASGAGPTVLLLHAGGEERGVWTPIAEILTRCGLRTVAFDLRGHGASSGQATTLEEIAEDVVAMIEQEPGPMVVVGASLGGLAAIAALPQTVGHIAGLILVDVVPNPDPAQVRAWLEGQGLLAEFAELVDYILAHGTEPPTIGVPMLLVRAGSTSPLTDAAVDRFCAANPTITVARIPSAGHLIAHDAPAELARLISDHASYWLLPEQTRNSS